MKHKKIVKCWYELERAAKHALLERGKVFEYIHLKFQWRDIEGTPFLLMRLPSGRKLAYPRPRISHDRLTFFGNVKGTTWGDVTTWGGTLLENACQAVAADVLTNGCHNAEAEGYEIMTLIHDEALAFKREGQTIERFVELLTKLPAWAKGLPVEAKGKEVPFYLK
jgi:DNA polymerase